MTESTIDPRIRIRPSKALKDYLDEVDQSHLLEDKDEGLLLSDVRSIYETMKAGVSFHEVLSECELVLPEPKIPEKSPELKARLEKLQRQQENREYKKMTAGLEKPGVKVFEDDESIGKQIKELNSYLLLIVQFVFSVGTAFASGYLAPYYFYGVIDVGKRLLIGVILAFIVGIADLYFIIRYFLLTEGVIKIKPE